MTDPVYYKDWWEKNRKKVLAKRKERYRKDSGYRDAAIRRARAFTATQRLIRAARPAPVVWHDGQYEAVYRLPEFLYMINRSSDAFYRLRSKGVIPRPLHKDSSNRGMYSQSQLEYASVIFNLCDKGAKITYVDLKAFLHLVWTRNYNKTMLNFALKEIDNGKEGGRAALDAFNDQRRGSKAADRKGKEIRGRASNSKSKSGRDSKPRKLRKPSPRR